MVLRNHIHNRIISVLLIVILVLMLVFGSYVQSNASVAAGTLGGFSDVLAGSSVAELGGFFSGAGLLLVAGMGINYSTDRDIEEFQKEWMANGGGTPYQELCAVLQGYSCFKDKTAAEMRQMSSFSVSASEAQQLSDWQAKYLGVDGAAPTGTNLLTLLNSAVPYPKHVEYTFTSVDETLIFGCYKFVSVSDGISVYFKSPETTRWTWRCKVGPVGDLAFPAYFELNDTGVLALSVTANGQKSPATFGYGTELSAFMSTYGINEVTYTENKISAGSVINIPQVNSRADIANLTAADIVTSADTPSEPVESNDILKWLTGTGAGLLSDVAGTVKDIKDFFTNSAAATWQSIKDGITSVKESTDSIPKALDVGLGGVLQGLKDIPIPIVGPLAQILATVTSLSDTTAVDSSGQPLNLDFSPLKVNFKDKFPFCIPFDFVNLIKPFAMQPADFVFSIDLDTQYWSVHHAVDLSPFRIPILFFRYVVDFWFVFILMSRTKDFMKW